MQQTATVLSVLLLTLSLSPLPHLASASELPQDLLAIHPTDRITQAIDENQHIPLLGQRHPLATPQNEVGELPPDQPLEHIVLLLRPSAGQETALVQFLAAQLDPASPYYHQWLTPQAFGERFGASIHDMEQVAGWLQSHGMTLDEVPSAHRAIVFTGTVAQVEATFHTSMRMYSVNGELHFANSTDPQIPQALSEVVGGVLSLHNFLSAPLHVVAPAFTSGGAHYLMPQDWATIYDVAPVYTQNINGSGQSIAVLGRSDIYASDVAGFRSFAALPTNNPQIVINGANPGFPDSGDLIESSLDVEWAGAIAKSATVKFVTSKSGASDGIALSAQYAVGHNLAPIVSLSYGACEAAEGSGGNAFWNSLWQQAAAQGMSVFVAAGDSGAAGCDSASQTTATHGRAVNGLCSSAYDTCVGGTEFDDANASQYWSASNRSGQASALSYIPESVWNQSGGNGDLWAGGGGASIVYAKPTWQSAPGVPADGKRDVPDVSIAAATHDAYVMEVQGSLIAVAGTSAAAPSFASAMALVIENAGSAQGNVNPILYGLATRQLSDSDADVFHDITSGNNSVPGVTGYNAAKGYDAASGLGSIDTNLLVTHWKDFSGANFGVASNYANISVVQGGSNTLLFSQTDAGGFNSPVKLTASGLPSGVTLKFASATVTTSDPVAATISAASNAALGKSTVTITGTGGGLTRTLQFTLTVAAPPTLTLLLPGPAKTLKIGATISMSLSTTAENGFKSAVALSLSALPKGVTATFAPKAIASPGTGSSTLTLSAASSAATVTANLTLTATGGGLTKTQPLTLIVTH